MKRRGMLSLIMALVLVVSAAFGTYAWFTSTPTSTNNVFKTGTLVLNSPGTITSNMLVSNIYPGWSESKTVTISNSGTLDLKYKMSIQPINNILYNGTTPILVTVNGQGPVEMNKLGEIYLGEIPANDDGTFVIGFRMPTTAGNAYQNKSANFTFNFTAAQIEDTTFTVSEGIKWIMDRSEPAGFEAVKNDGKDAIKVTINSPVNSSSFYNTQGYKKPIMSSSSNWQVSSSLYVSNDMLTDGNQYKTGLWVSSIDQSGEIQAYPIMIFKHDTSETGWYYFNDEDGAYELVPGAIAGWNKVEIKCVDKVVSFYINGNKVKEKTYEVSIPLSEYMLNTSNFGSTYSVYWTNPTYQIND